MNEVEPNDTAMTVLGMALNEASLWLLEKNLGKRPRLSHIEKAAKLMHSCAELLAEEIHEADKVRAGLAALRKELSNRGIEIEARGGRWEWVPE